MLAFYIKIVIILSNLTSIVAGYIEKEEYGINHTLQTLINSENLYDCSEEIVNQNMLKLTCNYKLEQLHVTKYICVGVPDGYICM